VLLIARRWEVPIVHGLGGTWHEIPILDPLRPWQWALGLQTRQGSGVFSSLRYTEPHWRNSSALCNSSGCCQYVWVPAPS